MSLSILYRGPLSSCNYDCSYCPFAKRRDPRRLLEQDRVQLNRFISWVEATTRRQIGVLFTPWGEALVRKWYRDAMCRLSHMRHVKRVAIQTNLSCPLEWLDGCSRDTVGLWCTFHPSQTTLDRFVAQCRTLDAMAIRYSVGVVGLHEHFPAIEALRDRLPPEVYLWINAYKRQADYYTPSDVDRLSAIDPLFEMNNCRYRSLGRPCRAGHSVIAVDGDGDARRCHFIPERIGNIYEPDFERALHPRPCTQSTCGCHIGYVHMPELELYNVFGNGVLERIPARPLTRTDAAVRLAAMDASVPAIVPDDLVQVSTFGR